RSLLSLRWRSTPRIRSDASSLARGRPDSVIRHTSILLAQGSGAGASARRNVEAGDRYSHSAVGAARILTALPPRGNHDRPLRRAPGFLWAFARRTPPPAVSLLQVPHHGGERR